MRSFIKMSFFAKKFGSLILSSQIYYSPVQKFPSTCRQISVRFASKYKAAVLTKFGEKLEIQDLKQKSLKANEVRVGVYCCGVNSIDMSNCLGELEPKPSLPFVPGFEVCGEILEVSSSGSEASKLKTGQRVIGLEMKALQGGFAEEMIMSAKDVFKIDNAVSFAAGASLIYSYATALIALTRRAEVKEGDFVLITGAGGRLGLACVDLAANVYRCKVIAATSSEEKSEVVRERGAFATVSLGSKNMSNQINKLTGGKGVPVIIDTVGGDVFKEVTKCVEDEGKVIVAGFASKKIPQVSGEELMENSFSVLGVSLDQYRRKKFEVYRESVGDVIDMCKEKLIHPYNASHYKLEDINEGLGLLKQQKMIGKMIVDAR